MTEDEINLKAAVSCMARHIPFVLFSLPGESGTHFFADPDYGHSAMTCESFLICPWLGRHSGARVINAGTDATGIIESDIDFSDREFTRPIERSTGETGYITAVSELICRLKLRGGKTVYSRVETGSMDGIEIAELVRLQFGSHPSTFRYFYFIPESGAWLGTSPEILLDTDLSTSEFKTMSLAGTCRTDSRTPWDNKNIAEQGLVGRFIADELRKENIDFTVRRCADVVFEPVRHICDVFAGHITADRIAPLLDRLSPTPALGGYPREDALRDIEDLERHQRRDYGGYIGYRNARREIYYVNLRCINFDTERFCIYAGGGITASSVPGPEWTETLNKTEILRQNLKKSCTGSNRHES